MTDIQRAMLGDREAAARLTERRMMIPCPCCGGVATLHTMDMFASIYATCQTCGLRTSGYNSPDTAIKYWNTRAPLLTPKQIDMLERMESNEA